MNISISEKCICNRSYKFWISVFVLLLATGFVGCTASDAPTQTVAESKYEISAEAININTASAAELERIPFIGEQLAAKIVEHRNRFGPFKRPEHLMLIDGISDKRFRQVRHLVRVE